MKANDVRVSCYLFEKTMLHSPWLSTGRHQMVYHLAKIQILYCILMISTGEKGVGLREVGIDALNIYTTRCKMILNEALSASHRWPEMSIRALYFYFRLEKKYEESQYIIGQIRAIKWVHPM